MAIELIDSADLSASAYARVLLTGDPKAGKTTCVLLTASKPILVLNCDGDGAPMAAKRHGAEFQVVNVGSVEQLAESIAVASNMAAEGKINTIVVDTITLLVNMTLVPQFRYRFRNDKDASYSTYRESNDTIITALRQLLNVQAHLILIAHYDTHDGLITLEGKLKKDVPAMVHDRVHLEFNPKKTPARRFLVGPVASGISGGRSSDESKEIAADVQVLLKELGFTD